MKRLNWLAFGRWSSRQSCKARRRVAQCKACGGKHSLLPVHFHFMSRPFPSPLSSPRLILRRLERDDAAAICGYRSLPEVARYQSWESFGPKDAARFIDEQREAEPGVPGTWFQMAIVEKESG